MTSDQKEEFRRLVLGYLVRRAMCAFNCVSVQQAVRREMPCTEEECEQAMLFLKSSGYLDEVPNKLGSRRYYTATSAGILLHERGE